jgi:hypothetical protein
VLILLVSTEAVNIIFSNLQMAFLETVKSACGKETRKVSKKVWLQAPLVTVISQHIYPCQDKKGWVCST